MLPIQIYKQTFEDALETNQTCINDWTEHKKNLQELKKNLENYPKELSHEVLVPLGKHALIRGKLVHTNEILIKFGSDTFIKRTAHGARETCGRLINYCDKWIDGFKKEQQLLSSNLSAIFNPDVFGSSEEQSVDITEPYDEEVEKEWRSRRKEMVNKCKLEEKEKTDQVSFKNVMKKLGELEIEEEHKNELREEKPDDNSDISDDLTFSEDEDEYENLADDILPWLKHFNEDTSSYEIDTFKNYGKSGKITEDRDKISEKSEATVNFTNSATIENVFKHDPVVSSHSLLPDVVETVTARNASVITNNSNNNNNNSSNNNNNNSNNKRVSFSKELIAESTNANCDDISIIYFRHYDNYEQATYNDREKTDAGGDSLNKSSPSDMINMFCSVSPPKVIDKATKSILKKTSSTANNNNNNIDYSEEMKRFKRTTSRNKLKKHNHPVAFTGEVISRSSDETTVIQSSENRPISRFKMTRSQTKRQ